MSVYKAINKVQADLAREGIAKDRNNQQQGYKFRGIDDVYNALSPLLAKHGLCVLPRCTGRDVVERVTAKGTAIFYVTVCAEFDFVAAEDGSKHTVVTYGEAMDTGDKATNKAMSAAYKYACMQAFSIPTEGDNDADAQTHEVRSRGLSEDQSTGNALGMFPAATQAKIRKTAAAAIQAFSEGADWTAYEEVTSLWNKYPEGDERNQIKLALSSIFKKHPALRSAIKRMADEERAREPKETA
jgi:hypothetical protein